MTLHSTVSAPPSRLAAVAAALVALTFAGHATAAKIAKETFVSSGRERVYYLAAPKEQDPAKPVPLVILLHGSNRDGSSLVEKWRKLAEKEGFITVGPDAGNPAFWKAPEDGPALLRDLVDHLRTRFTIDPRRVYLFGHSAGAGFALQMGLFESRYFAAVAIHAGAFRGGEEKWLPALAARKIPFHIAVGDRDAYYPLDTVRATRDALQAQGLSVDLVEMPRHDHWYYDLAPKINQAAWAFLRAHALDEEPVYEERNLR